MLFSPFCSFATLAVRRRRFSVGAAKYRPLAKNKHTNDVLVGRQMVCCRTRGSAQERDLARTPFRGHRIGIARPWLERYLANPQSTNLLGNTSVVPRRKATFQPARGQEQVPPQPCPESRDGLVIWVPLILSLVYFDFKSQNSSDALEQPNRPTLSCYSLRTESNTIRPSGNASLCEVTQ